MKKASLHLLFLLYFASAIAQVPPKPFGPLPTEGQLQWQETEMYCIIHFGPDTYTNREWGYGDEDPHSFNPRAFDAMQIVGAARAGGFKGIIVVAKHHDGFCLWPTATTSHNISASPYKEGKGDLLHEYRQACDRLGMKMGVYCSPWDRNSPLYGKSAYVTKVYRGQLEELYSRYGPLFIVWHDGANGGDGYYGGAREVRNIDRSSYYGWDSTWNIARRLQPGAVIFGDAGPDIRWVGNEQGHAGETCWETYTPHAPEPGKAPANGFTRDSEGTAGQRDGKYWMPAECDVPFRPGWFYHPAEDGMAKTPDSLMNLYFLSVGRGACLDLGLEPDRRGQISDDDVHKLKAFGAALQRTFAVNLARGARLQASNVRGNNGSRFGPRKLLDNDRYSYWATDDSVHEPELIIYLSKSTTFDIIRLRENVKLGQRIEACSIDNWQHGRWQSIASATSIGGNRLIHLPRPVRTSRLRLRITRSPVCVALSDFGLFLEKKPV